MGNCKSRAQADKVVASSRPEKRARLMFYGRRGGAGTFETAIGSSRSEDSADKGDGTSFATDNSGLVGMNLLGAEGSSFATDNSGLVGVSLLADGTSFNSGLGGVSLLADGTSFTTENSGLIGVSLLGETASFSEHDDDRSTMFTQSPRGRNSPGRLFNSQNHNHNHRNSYNDNDPNGLRHHTLFDVIEDEFQDEVEVVQSLLLIKSPSDPRKLDEYYATANNAKRSSADQFQNTRTLGIGAPTRDDEYYATANNAKRSSADQFQNTRTLGIGTPTRDDDYYATANNAKRSSADQFQNTRTLGIGAPTRDDEYYATANNAKRSSADQFQNTRTLGIGTPNQDYYSSQLISLDESIDDIKASLEHIQEYQQTGGSSSRRGGGGGAIRRRAGSANRRRNVRENDYQRDYIRRAPKSRNKEAYRGLQRSLQLQDDGGLR